MNGRRLGSQSPYPWPKFVTLELVGQLRFERLG